MQTYEIIVQGRAVKPNSADTTLVRTSIGIDRMHVLFDNDEWTDFPVKATFANGDAKVTQSLTLSDLETDQWAAEAECVIPWEVIQATGGIRITFQGTDSSGNHIITEASGTPLQVVEAGDVQDGTVPSGAPTISEWEQAYADAMAAANAAASVVENLEDALDDMIAAAEDDIAAMIDMPIATESTLGAVMVGDGLEVEADGTISALDTNGLTADQAAALANLRRLASADFDSTFDEDGNLTAATVKSSALPKATALSLGAVKPDGSTIGVDANGTASVSAVPASLLTGTVSTDNLPSYVDDVIEGYYYQGAFYTTSSHATEITGEAGKVYVDLSTDDSYRWSGSAYVRISSPIDLASQAEAEAGSDNAKMMTPLRTAQAIAALETTYDAATQSAAGLMSATDKAKLDAIESGAQVNPGAATTTADGLMSSTDKSKLDGIEAQANKVTAGSGLTLSSGALSLGPIVEQGNPCHGPIFGVEGEGWSEQVQTTGKNLMDVSTANTSNRATISESNGRVTLTRSNASGYAYVGYKVPLTAGTYTVAFDVVSTVGTLLSLNSYDSGDTILEVIVDRQALTECTFTAPSDTAYVLVYLYVGVSSGTVGDTANFSSIQLELGSTATSYESYSGGAPSPSPDYPQEIEVCRGRNLVSERLAGMNVSSSGGTVVTTSSGYDLVLAEVVAGEVYTFSHESAQGVYAFFTSKPALNSVSYNASRTVVDTTVTSHTFTAPISGWFAGRIASSFAEPQLEPDSTPSPYVPYGHIGLDIYDSQSQHVSTTPIPLPAKGWAGGLPDGTADALSIDSAGRWEWVNETQLKVHDGSEDWVAFGGNAYYYSTPDGRIGAATLVNSLCDSYPISANNVANMPDKSYRYGDNGLKTIYIKNSAYTTLADFKAALASNPVTILYPLATPTTESGYIDLPALPEGAVVSIPELQSCGVSWAVPGAGPIFEHVGNVYRRIESAIAELATS